MLYLIFLLLLPLLAQNISSLTIFGITYNIIDCILEDEQATQCLQFVHTASGKVISQEPLILEENTEQLGNIVGMEQVNSRIIKFLVDEPETSYFYHLNAIHYKDPIIRSNKLPTYTPRAASGLSFYRNFCTKGDKSAIKDVCLLAIHKRSRKTIWKNKFYSTKGKLDKPFFILRQMDDSLKDKKNFSYFKGDLLPNNPMGLLVSVQQVGEIYTWDLQTGNIEEFSSISEIFPPEYKKKVFCENNLGRKKQPDVSIEQKKLDNERREQSQIHLAPGICKYWLPKPDPICMNNIRQVVRRKQAQINYCHTKALKTDPDLSGKIVAVVSIENGTVTDVNTSKNKFGSQELKTCIERKISTWEFLPKCTETVALPFILEAPPEKPEKK